jgi:predicted PurR-regulated permease PerM
MMTTSPPSRAHRRPRRRVGRGASGDLPRAGRALIILLTILAGAAVAWLAWQALAHVAHLLLLLGIALLVAFILAPAVAWLERRLPRPAAIALAFVGALGLLAAALVIFLGPLVAQLASLAGSLPDQVRALQGVREGIDRALGGLGLPVRLADAERPLLDQTQAIGTIVLGGALGLLGGLAGALLDGLLVLVLSFYLLLDSTRIHDNLVRLVPARWRPQVFFVEAAVGRVVGGYLRGQLIMALTVGVAAGVGCWLLGVPYPLVIGLLAGVFELVPMLGPILGAVPALLISLPQGFPQVLWVLLLFIAIQQVEANVIGPRITGHAVGLHPLGALLALIAGAELGGLGGALVAVPVAGILYVLGVAVYWQWRGQPLPNASRPPARWPDVARGLGRWRGPAAPGATATPVDGPVPPLAGSEAARPTALASLDQRATGLRERFEQGERARQAERDQLAEAADAAERGQ